MLTVENLRRPGLGPLSFHIDGGECLALTGPSGAGKTLLLRALADLDLNEGEVVMGGRLRSNLPAPEWRRRLGYVPAETGWWADLVGDHFSTPLQAAELLAQLGFTQPSQVLDWPVARLSSGERQRLALARGLCCNTEVLLLDEPTSALDLDNAELVEQLLQNRLRAGTCILLVSHDSAQVGRLAGRSIHLENGRLAAPL